MAVRELTLNFLEDSMVAISGQNGSGKSTLVYATAFALTAHRIESISYKDYIKTGCDHALVELDADLDRSPFHCVAEIRKSGVTRTVTYKDKTYVNSEYNQFMEEHDMGILQKLMFIFEGRNSIVDSTPAERASLLKELFQLDFSDIVAELKEKQSDCKDTIIRGTATLESLKSRDFTRHPLQREPMKSAVTKWTERICSIEEDLAKLKDLDEGSVTRCSSKLDKTRKDIDSLTQKLGQERSKRASVDNLYQSVKERIQNADITLWRADLTKAEDLLTEHAEQYKKDSKTYKGLEGNLNVCKHDMKTVEEQIAIAETGICHACGQPVGKEHMNSLMEKKSCLEANLLDIQQSMEELAFDPSDREAQVLTEHMNEIASRIQSYESDCKDIEYYEHRLKDADDLIASHEEHLENLKDSEEMLQKELFELETLKPLIAQKETLQTERDSLQESIQNAHDIEVSNNEKRRMNEKLKKDEEARDDLYKELSENTNALSLQMETTKQTLGIFENLFPNYVVLQACKRLEDYINAIIQKLFPYMKVRLKQNKGGVNFFYTPEGPDDEERSVRLASGAQKIILSLAYNVAMARMYGITCIMIDEADARMTPENAGLVYDFISSLEDFSQIIFISHRPESREAIKASGRNNLRFYEVNHGEYMEVSG